MKRILSTFLFIVIFVFFAPNVRAQVVINEVSSASDPEWVELYNTSSAAASLKGYSINFGTDSQNKFFCDGEVVNENSYKIISLTSHWLADSGDVVTLKNGDDATDSIGYGSGHSLGKPFATGSISRSPDGSSNWVLLSLSTQQGDAISFGCPTLAPTATPQPTPTPTPDLTPIKTPTPVPTPLRTPNPAPTKPPSPTPTSIPEEIVLGLETALSSSLAGETIPDLPEKPKEKIQLLAIGLITLGTGFMGFSVFSIIKNVKKSYTGESEKENNQIS